MRTTLYLIALLLIAESCGSVSFADDLSAPSSSSTAPPASAPGLVLDFTKKKEAQPRPTSNTTGTFDSLPQWRKDMVTAFTMKQQGMYAQALPYAEKAAKEAETAKVESKNLALVYNLLGGVYRYCRRPDDAIKSYERALSITETLGGKWTASYATVLDNLAQVYSAKRELTQTARCQRQAIAIYEKVLPHNSPDLAITLGNYAKTLESLGKLDEAIKTAQEGIAIYHATLPADDPRLATAYDNMGGYYRSERKLEQAEKYHRDALAIYKEKLGPVHPDTTICTNNLAGTLVAEGKDTEAKELLEEHIAALKETNSPSLPEFARSAGQMMDVILGRQSGQK